MEIEKDKTIPFLDTSVIRASDVLFTTTVYRKSIHTNQCLALDLYHPQSVERSIVKCLYDRAKHLETKPSVISGEKKHLSSVLVSKHLVNTHFIIVFVPVHFYHLVFNDYYTISL